MHYDFLKQFEYRMRHVGRYARLIQGSDRKQIWKDLEFETLDEQLNVLFTVLLYIMEQSLKEETCTLDDIAAFLDSVNKDYLKRPMSYDDCRALSDYIVNNILSNDGRPMYFEAMNYSEGMPEKQHVSFIANRVDIKEDGVQRISYYVTDDGYNMLLSTLEIENNMKLTIYEMIFKLHLEKQSYDKAADAIKTVFNTIRIQVQRIEESMRRVRRNALDYSVEEYDALMHENLDTVHETRRKLSEYRENVRSREKELEKIDLSDRKLSDKEEENLRNLRVIEDYLKRSIDEHQKVLNLHFDLKSLYDKELELLTQMRFIRRFSLREELFEKLKKHPQGMEYLGDLYSPLFVDDPEKVFHPGKIMEAQRPMRRRSRDTDEEILEFGDESWVEEQLELKRKKLKLYEDSIRLIVKTAMQSPDGEISLSELKEYLSKHPRYRKICIPGVNIFKEIIVEMVRRGKMDIAVLRKEKEEHISDEPSDFQLGDVLLALSEEFQRLAGFEAYGMEEKEMVVFGDIEDEDGSRRSIRCSDVLIRVRME